VYDTVRMTHRYRPRKGEKGANRPRPVAGLGERAPETGVWAQNRRGGAFAYLGLGRQVWAPG